MSLIHRKNLFPCIKKKLNFVKKYIVGFGSLKEIKKN